MSTQVQPYLCYILRSARFDPPRGRTYVGITKKMEKRLRQHNGELKGGARSTQSARPWEVICTIAGFADKSTAMKFEWRMHRRNPIKPRPSDPVKARLLYLQRVLSMEKWTTKSPQASEVPLQVVWYMPAQRPADFQLPNYITEINFDEISPLTQSPPET